MPAYFGGRKVKELYLGGRKIKEAWYDGKKVYSLAVGPPGTEPWYQGRSYSPGETVLRAGKAFVCTSEHRGSTYNEPGLGPDWNDYWIEWTTLTSAPDWKEFTTYRVGNIVKHKNEYYKCSYTHRAEAAWNEPNAGSIWTGYWDKIATPGGSNESTPTQPQPPKPPSNTPTTWRTGVNYSVNDHVIWSGAGMKREYLCIKDHRSTSDTEPYWGLLQDKHWRLVKEIS